MRTLDLLEAPPASPIRGGIMAAANVVDSPNNEFLHQHGVIQTVTCGVPAQAPYDCFTNVPIPDADKDPHGVWFGEATTFSLYFGVECYLQANENDQEFIERARQGLIAGEGAGIEVIGQDLLNEITPETIVESNLVDAIGRAELLAGNNWGHLPTIFMDRMTATRAIAAHAVFPGLDWTLTTGQGTPVVNAGGFTKQNAIWVTGEVSIVRGPINVARAVHPTLNREMVIAERSYGLWVDCGGFMVEFTGPTPGGQNPDPTPLVMLLGSIPSSPIPDGTDTTITVQTNVTPSAEVYLYYAVNGDPPQQAGEMTQVTPHEFVWNVVGDSTGPGDTVEVWAVTQYDGDSVESNHIEIDVTEAEA